MLSYMTPAKLKADNAEGERILRERNGGKPVNVAASEELSAVQRKDFAEALEARKRG